MADLSSEEALLMKYIDGEMAGSERAAFEKRISADASLRKRVEALSLAREAVKHHGLREQVASVRKDWEAGRNQTQPQKAKLIPFRKTMRYVAIAASVILIVVVLKIFIPPSLSSERVYDEAYVNYSLNNSRSSNQENSPLVTAYQDKNYEEVVRLGRHQRIPPNEQLLLGIAYLETNAVTDAIGLLSGLREQTSVPYHADADFYLALAYLKNKDYDNALGLFQRIQGDPAHPYHAQVTQKIIDDVNELKK